MAVPNIFGTATAAIPLSQLDTNFATAITLGNTAVYLGNTTTSLGNVTLTNVTVSSGNVTITGANVSGNLAFTGTGNRITGDFSNATIANRLCLQNSVVNGASIVQAIPNGTGTTSGFSAFNNSDPTNAANIVTFASSTEARVSSGITGTGTYLPMTFFTGGSERARIDTSGNVGIGTSSPSDKLTVISAGTQVGSTNFRNIARIGLATNDASVLLGYDVSAGSAILASTNNYPIAFWTSIAGTYAEKMRIDSSGNVGIGTSSPTGKLNVVTDNTHNGGATFDSTGTTQIWMRDTNSTANTKNWGFQISGGDFNILRANDDRATGFVTPVSFAQAPANSLIIDVSGNVGMGTASPSVKLDAVGATGIRVRYDTSGAGISLQQPVASGGDAYLLNQANNAFIFGTNNTERMRIDSSGNLLVGTTTNPGGSARLGIKGSGTTISTVSFYIINSSSVGNFLVYDDGSINTGTTSAGSPYVNTTATGANAVFAANGFMQRSTSSLKYKTDIQDATHGLTDLLKLRSVTYKGKNDGDIIFGGLIAEEVDAAGLNEFVQYSADGSPDALAYGNMVSLCVKAIQEQQALITALTARIEALESN